MFYLCDCINFVVILFKIIWGYMFKRLLTLFILTFFITGALFAESIIKGTVKSDENNETLPGASVALIGTKQGAKTNAEGKYEIKISNVGRYTLRVTYIGYTPM